MQIFQTIRAIRAVGAVAAVGAVSAACLSHTINRHFRLLGIHARDAFGVVYDVVQHSGGKSSRKSCTAKKDKEDASRYASKGKAVKLGLFRLSFFIPSGMYLTMLRVFCFNTNECFEPVFWSSSPTCFLCETLSTVTPAHSFHCRTFNVFFHDIDPVQRRKIDLSQSLGRTPSMATNITRVGKVSLFPEVFRTEKRIGPTKTFVE